MSLHFVAIHDFEPVDPGEIRLTQNDEVIVLPPIPDKNDWWNGTNLNTQEHGYFPGNYVTYKESEVPPVPPRRTNNANSSMVGELKDMVWYWGNASREVVNESMKNMPDGTFLVRDAMQDPGQYTLTLRKGGMNKLIRIISKDGKYGFSPPLEYSSVPMLVEHFKANSLSQYNSGLDISLTNPLSRHQVSPGEGNNVDALQASYITLKGTVEQLSSQFEREANKKASYIESIERLKKIQIAQGDVITWLENQHKLIAQRMMESRHALLKENLTSLESTMIKEKQMKDDVALNLDNKQGLLRKVEAQLRRLKAELRDNTRKLNDIETSLRCFGIDPDMTEQVTGNDTLVKKKSKNQDYDECTGANYVLPPGNMSQNSSDTFDMGTYFIENRSRDEIRRSLINKPDGTFLIRPSFHHPGSYTLDIVVSNEIKKVTILHDNGMYGLVLPTRFPTLSLLVQHYSRVSLREHNRQLDTRLLYPVYDPRFANQ